MTHKTIQTLRILYGVANGELLLAGPWREPRAFQLPDPEYIEEPSYRVCYQPEPPWITYPTAPPGEA